MNELKMSVTNVEINNQQKHTNVAVLQAQGNLGPENYLELVERSEEIYKSGQRKFILDIHEVTKVGLAGIFALLSVATVFSGKDALDPQGGWHVLHQAADKLIGVIPGDFRIVTKQAQLEAVAQQIGFPVYHDLETALASID